MNAKISKEKSIERCPFCDNTDLKKIKKNGTKECTFCHHVLRSAAIKERKYDISYVLNFMKKYARIFKDLFKEEDK